MARRSNSLEIIPQASENRVYVRSKSYDEDYTAIQRKSSFHVTPSIFCRQSTLTSIQNEDVDEAPPTKLIQSRKDIVILIGMVMVEFTSTCAMSIIAPFFAPEAEKKGASSTIVGMIFAVYPLFVFCLSPLVGKWMPRIGVKFCLIAGCFLEGGTMILFGFVTELPNGFIFVLFCFLIRIVLAWGSSMSATAGLSILTVTFKANIGKVFAITEISSGLGYMVGPTIGGVLYQYAGFKIPFLVCGSAVILVLFGAFVILPPEETYHVYKEEGEEEIASIIQIITVPGIFVVGICVITAGMVLSFFDPTLTPFLQRIKPGITPESVGFVFLIISAAYTIGSGILGFFVNEKRGRYLMIVGLVGEGVGYFFLGPAPIISSFVPQSFGVVIGSIVVIGFLFGPFIVPILGDLQKSAKNGGVKTSLSSDSIISGLFNGFFSVGSVIGPTLGGVLSDYWSFEGASMVFSFALLGEALILLIFTLWEKNSKWGPGRTVGGFRKLEEEC